MRGHPREPKFVVASGCGVLISVAASYVDHYLITTYGGTGVHDWINLKTSLVGDCTRTDSRRAYRQMWWL